MKISSSLIPLWTGLLLVFPDSLLAELNLLPAMPIQYKVQVQPIRTQKNASTKADAFGNAETEAIIKATVDRIWAQIGIDIEFLPTTNHTDPYTFDGSPDNFTSAARPTSHLGAVESQTPSPPKSDEPNVINLFFVDICPGFYNVPDNFANGLAFVDSAGITVHVGAELIDPNSRIVDPLDIVASVIAHEIGHNLGLDHSNSSSSLMYSGASTHHHLTNADLATILIDSPWTDGADFLQETTVSNYDNWVLANGIMQSSTGDDDNDGVQNLVEFALGTNPKSPSSLPLPFRSGTGLRWNLTKNTEAAADGMVVGIEVSNNMSTFINAGSSGTTSTVHSNTNSSIQVSISGQTRYMRLKVTKPSNAAPFVPSPLLPLAGARFAGGFHEDSTEDSLINVLDVMSCQCQSCSANQSISNSQSEPFAHQILR